MPKTAGRSQTGTSAARSARQPRDTAPPGPQEGHKRLVPSPRRATKAFIPRVPPTPADQTTYGLWMDLKKAAAFFAKENG